MRVHLLIVAAVAAVAAVAGTPAQASPAVPYVEGPDRPPLTAPDQVLTVFDRAEFDSCFGVGTRSQAITVPSVPAKKPHPLGRIRTWDRVFVELTAESAGDPWDRIFSVSIDGVEILRGTTPRVTFTVRRDITEYAALLPPGGTANVRLDLGTYVGAWLGTLKLEFYDDEPTAALVAPPHDAALGSFLLNGLSGDGSVLTTTTTFPAAAPEAAVVDLTVTNHGPDEAIFAGRTFHVFVDGREIATMRPAPYTYAILGFGASNANQACTGPATTPTGQTINGAMWWTAQQALDPAGVHTGPGEIPPYRAQVDAADLPLLTGTRTVEVRQEGGDPNWVTSLSFLLSS